MAVYVPFFLNKVKDKQERWVNHTYSLVEETNFHEGEKMRQGEDRHYLIIIFRELLPCVPFCLLLS